jgi:hypothetical protein
MRGEDQVVQTATLNGVPSTALKSSTRFGQAAYLRMALASFPASPHRRRTTRVSLIDRRVNRDYA